MKSPTPEIERYLRELERFVKKKNGVIPEEALADAHEHLCRMQRDHPAHEHESSSQRYQQIVSTFGSPEQLAQQYADFVASPTMNLPGIAPGWRIHCRRCGRSKPAGSAGIIRIGAPRFVVGKRVLGWCRGCRRPRALVLSKDLDSENLTDEILSPQNDASLLRTLFQRVR